MAVVKVGIVQMLVADQFVLVPVGMRLGHLAVVIVIVMIVMHVAVLMLELVVHMHMLVPFGEVEPQSDPHQNRGND